MADTKPTTSDANQGEGNREAAAEYNKGATEFAHSGRAEPAAKDAADVTPAEQAELDAAEAEGKRRSHGEDPLLNKR